MGKDAVIDTIFFNHTGADDLVEVPRSRTYSFKPLSGAVKVLTERMALDASLDISSIDAADVNNNGIDWPQDQPYSNAESADQSKMHGRCWVRVPTGSSLIGDYQLA